MRLTSIYACIHSLSKIRKKKKGMGAEVSPPVRISGTFHWFFFFFYRFHFRFRYFPPLPITRLKLSKKSEKLATGFTIIPSKLYILKKKKNDRKRRPCFGDRNAQLAMPPSAMLSRSDWHDCGRLPAGCACVYRYHNGTHTRSDYRSLRNSRDLLVPDGNLSLFLFIVLPPIWCCMP